LGNLLERLATIPRNGRASTLRRVLTAISDATGWQHVTAVRMRDGQVKTVREALAYASEKPPSIRILANRVATLDPARAAFNRTDENIASDPEALTYMDQYGVEGFAISLPKTSGTGLYAEGRIDAAELALAQNALALWSKRRDTTNRRWTTRITLAAVAIALAIFLASPIPTDIGAPAEIEPAQSEIVVLGYEARLISLDARTGDSVAKGDVLARFTSTELVEAEKRATLDQMLETLGAQEALASEDYAEFQLAEQKKSIAVFRADQSRRRLDSLTLRAPQDGRVASIVPERNIGTQLPEGAPVAEIQIGDQMRARLNVSSADAPRIAPGQTGEILVRGALNRSWPITVIDRPVLSENPQTGTAGHTVMVRIDGDASALQKGLTGYARLSGEIQPRIMVWLTPVLEYLRFTAWKYLGSQL
jgi:multidrug resistance efflux pump